MSGDDIAVLRDDIRNLDDKINDNCKKVAIIETKIAGDDALRRERQAELDKRLGKIEIGVDTIITRNSEVDGWFAGTKKLGLWLATVAGGLAGLLALLKFVLKVI
jgi:hypothetical protein